MYKETAVAGIGAYKPYPGHVAERSYLMAKQVKRLRHLLASLPVLALDTELALPVVGGGTAQVAMKDVLAPLETALGVLHAADATALTVEQAAALKHLVPRFAVQQLWEAMHELHSTDWDIHTGTNKLTLPGAMQVWVNKDADNKKRMKIRLPVSLTDNLTVNYVDKTITQEDDGNGNMVDVENVIYPEPWVPFDAFGGGIETPA